MHTTNFQTREVGPGLSSHSKQLTHNINIHIIAPSQFSLDELLKVELKREIFIEIDGLNDRQWSILANDAWLRTTRPSRTGRHLSLTISNRDLEAVVERVSDLTAHGT